MEKKLLWLNIKIIYSANINKLFFFVVFFFFACFALPPSPEATSIPPPSLPKTPYSHSRPPPIPPTLTQPPTYLFLTILNIHSPL